ncbi:MAG: FkbM family methyltransferase [Thermomicrobiales bacterium]
MNLEALIVRTERGLMRKLPPSVALCSNAKLHWLFGEPELHELSKLVRPGTLAIDIGAHFGTYSRTLAKLVGKRGQVISIEPIEEDARMLERAARQLHLPIEVVHCALSSENGFAEMYVPSIHGYEKTALSSLEPGEPRADSRRVATKRLDDVLAGNTLPVSFIKIDVEGHEIDVLQGGLETLRTHKSAILIEINNDLGHRPVEAVFDLIVAQGYRGEFLESGKYRRPLSAFDVTKHQISAADNVLSKDYVNNFIFMPL